ncbi:MAG: flagellar biosynthetic protein FliR [Solirubrobacterales bacterium]|nr:flagellar biosynthetic protein FliR [Solirubrobacterales bacterium]
MAESAAQELLTRFSEQQLAGFFLVLCRLTPLFIMAPLFSSKLVPARVRGIIAVALAVGLSPVVVGTATIPTAPAELGALIFKELLIGFGFTFVIAALFAAVTVAGTFLDTLIGFSYGSLIDPINGTQTTVLSQFYSMLAILIFIAIGGDAWVIEGMARTYDVVGILQMPDLNGIIAGADAAFVNIFAAAVEIAGPVMLALILSDVAFGMVSRLAPQLNVFVIGFPVKIIVGLALIGVSLPFFGTWLADEVQISVSQALMALKLA